MVIEFGSVQKMLQLVCTYSEMFYIVQKRKQNNKTQTWNNSQDPVFIFGEIKTSSNGNFSYFYQLRIRSGLSIYLYNLQRVYPITADVQMCICLR